MLHCYTSRTEAPKSVDSFESKLLTFEKLTFYLALFLLWYNQEIMYNEHTHIHVHQKVRKENIRDSYYTVGKQTAESVNKI